VADLLTFSASVQVRAEAAAVFALMSDPPRKAVLNPNVQVIRVEHEGDGPVAEGSIFYHRLQKGQRIFEYRSRCLRIVRPRLFESRAETDPPFEVRVTVEPTPEGCRLTQEEILEVTPHLLDAVDSMVPAERTSHQFRALFSGVPGLRHLAVEWRSLQRERLAKKLAGELQAWLEAIKAHLEARETAGADGRV
jgi:hypothetical protein